VIVAFQSYVAFVAVTELELRRIKIQIKKVDVISSFTRVYIIVSKVVSSYSSWRHSRMNVTLSL
jgi:hypothetical protein